MAVSGRIRKTIGRLGLEMFTIKLQIFRLLHGLEIISVGNGLFQWNQKTTLMLCLTRKVLINQHVCFYCTPGPRTIWYDGTPEDKLCSNTISFRKFLKINRKSINKIDITPFTTFVKPFEPSYPGPVRYRPWTWALGINFDLDVQNIYHLSFSNLAYEIQHEG